MTTKKNPLLIKKDRLIKKLQRLNDRYQREKCEVEQELCSVQSDLASEGGIGLLKSIYLGKIIKYREYYDNNIAMVTDIVMEYDESYFILSNNIRVNHYNDGMDSISKSIYLDPERKFKINSDTINKIDIVDNNDVKETYYDKLEIIKYILKEI